MTTKSEVINDAYDELRISGLTVNPSPSDLVNALDRLEGMMAEFFTSWNLNVGYNFEATPDINSETNVPLNYKYMMAYCLAIRLIPLFNKQVPQQLYRNANSAWSNAIAARAAETVRHVQPSRKMPRGSGNAQRNQYWRRFMDPPDLARNEAASNFIDEGETQSYEESFSAWLGSNTISSYTITSDPRLTVDSSSNNDPVISYTISASTDSERGPLQYVKITVTDSAGRVEIRLISFQVQEVPDVPEP